MFLSSLVAALLVSASEPQLEDTLGICEALKVREGTYGQPIAECAPPPNSSTRTLLVSEAVRKVYAVKPAATVELLLRIADGGSPPDSIVAASDVLELAGGPGAGLGDIQWYNWDTYDQTEPNRKSTQRDFMLRVAKMVDLKSLDGKQ